MSKSPFYRAMDKEGKEDDDKDKDKDIYGYEKRLEDAMRVLAGSRTTERNKETIRRFIDHLEVQGVSTGRLAKYAYHLKVIGELLPKGFGFEDCTRKDIERLVASLRLRGYSPNTFFDYIMVIKRLFKFVRYGNVDRETPFPDEVKWLRKTIKQNEMKQPEFFSPDEVERMIGAADMLRDKAMISVGFEGGLRASELLLLDIGDLAFDERGVRVKVRGKTGERTIRLISSAPLLSRFIETHPFRKDPAAPLWTSEAPNLKREGRRLAWSSWDRRLKEIAKKAGINGKRIHNHLLRHGSATQAAKFLTDSELKVFYGWTMGSKMPATYIHLSGQDLDEKLERLHEGRVLEPPKVEFTPVLCPRCGEKNTPGMKFCGRCGTPLDQGGQAKERAEIESLKMELDRIKETLEKALSRPSR